MAIPKPGVKPVNPCFSSGPCAKRPGWSLAALAGALLGRSHRSKPARRKLAGSSTLTRDPRHARGLSPRHRAGLRHRRGRDRAVVAARRRAASTCWPGRVSPPDWATDIVKQLKLTDARVLEAPYGGLPDLGALDFPTTSCFAWNGTTSGVRVPNADWIPADREGLAICDATSAAFAMDLLWRQARCRDLSLAEGAGRRGGAWHADPLAARGRAAREP